MKRSNWLIFVVLVLLAMIAIVKVQNRQPQNSPVSVPDGILVVGTTHDIDSFNPLFSESSLAREIIHLTLLGLADLDDHSNFQGELAESWERSSDYYKLRYHLRKDAFWSDGVPVSASDVIFTYELLKDPKVASPNAWVTDFIREVVALDSFTVEFRFTKPYPDQIFDTAGEILPKHIFEKIPRDQIRSHPVNKRPLANGPFMLEKWVPQQYIILKPNPYYFGPKPKLNQVIFKIVPDKTNLMVQLQTGEIDMVTDVDPNQVTYLKKHNPELSLYPVSGRTYYYIGYNEANALFQEREIRRALTMGLDVSALIEATLQGFGEPCTGPIPPILEWAFNKNIKPLPFALKEAKKILEQNGWADHDGDGWLDKDGQRFEFVLRTNAGNKIKEDVAVIAQEQWRKLGIKVRIETLEWANFQQKLRARDFDAYIGGWSTALHVDPTPLFHSTATNLFNYIGYKNPEIDRLIEKGRETMDRERAAELWKLFQEKIYSDQPYTFLFWLDKIVAVHSRFKNVTPRPISMFYNLEYWYEAPQNID